MHPTIFTSSEKRVWVNIESRPISERFAMWYWVRHTCGPDARADWKAMKRGSGAGPSALYLSGDDLVAFRLKFGL